MANNKYNATCAICGSPYYLCMSCQDNMQLRPWKLHTDTSEHYKVFQILRAYNSGMYNKTEAKAALKNVNLADKDTYLPVVKDLLAEIFKVERTTKKINKANKTNKRSKSESKNSEQ